MTLEQTMQDMFDRYPLLFQDRADCLNQLFCVLGNGYGWKNGELVSIRADEDEVATQHELVNGRAVQHNILTPRAKAILCAKISGRPVDEARLAKLPDTPCQKRPRRERWYFTGHNIPGQPRTIRLYKKYVPLWNVPEDVKPDWMAAIRECKTMLLEDGIIQESDL